MKNFRLIRCLVSLGAISVILSTSGKLVAQSKNTGLQVQDINTCVTAKSPYGLSNFPWLQRSGEFALSREIFSYKWEVYIESEIVCRANSKYRTLRLDVAMRDEAKGVVTISLYKDGSQVN
ncbi:MAG: hypothetical protein KME49_03375 [Brasilonema octagenarum HA4186-MV1]|jgi:hypothetical protein|uniref:Uncharacterized protein n=2 Tax=Brasilonema TaxID=383614 RepID=A0A856M8M0_9CYAN|nr:MULTISPECIES: hypothetical protein [Brasilonema]MBW4624566.1 hypothetical protein [Brasilonema octagenarum HA4186-MV1]NMF67026.1 hypothetical protein [Brasilonema octagenarum UFV-OR1]QDL07503.1 hypothetical protein DP114_05965 [Brasilonema sennae CENA114]QDL13865.1 hypothetical protein DP113_05920 [Brasilonema octagenarum UFV-E1]